MALHIWCMKRLPILHLLCSTPWVTQAVQTLWQWGSLHIFFLCGCPSVFLTTPPWNLSLSHCETVYLAGATQALLRQVVLEWLPTHGPFHQTCMCAHFGANTLISPPVLLSISVGSWAVGDDGCWQDLDCWGKDDARSWDPMEGLIRLLWKLSPFRPLATGKMQWWKNMYGVSHSPPYRPLHFLLLPTQSCLCGVPPLSVFFSQHSLESPLFSIFFLIDSKACRQ